MQLHFLPCNNKDQLSFGTSGLSAKARPVFALDGRAFPPIHASGTSAELNSSPSLSEQLLFMASLSLGKTPSFSQSHLFDTTPQGRTLLLGGPLTQPRSSPICHIPTFFSPIFLISKPVFFLFPFPITPMTSFHLRASPFPGWTNTTLSLFPNFHTRPQSLNSCTFISLEHSSSYITSCKDFQAVQSL